MRRGFTALPQAHRLRRCARPRAVLTNDSLLLWTFGRRRTRPHQERSGRSGMSAIVQSIDANKAEAQQDLTDGFHLVIDALKLNDIKAIYGVPGIPIIDFGRMAQAEGIRVILFRHEQNVGNAAAIAGFLTKKPGNKRPRPFSLLPVQEQTRYRARR